MTLHFRRNGTPYDPAQAIDSDGTVRDGEWVRVPLILKDRLASGLITFLDAAEPGSIDEALRTLFAAEAKRKGIKPAELLASMSQDEIEKIVTSVARSFVNSAASAGIAAEFGDATAAKATRDRALATRYGGSAPHTAAPVSIETTAAIRDAARRSRYATDAAPIASTPAAATATDTAAIRDQARRSRYATADAAPAEAAEIGANVGWRS